MSVFDGMAEIITGTFNPASPIYIIRPGEDRVAVEGVFISDYRDADGGDLGVVEDRRSAVSIRTADAADLGDGAGRVEHLGVLYKISGVQPDSKGLTRLVLKRAGLAPLDPPPA